MAKSNRWLQVVTLSLAGLWVFILGMVLTNEAFYDALVRPLIGS